MSDQLSGKSNNNDIYQQEHVAQNMSDDGVALAAAAATAITVDTLKSDSRAMELLQMYPENKKGLLQKQESMDTMTATTYSGSTSTSSSYVNDDLSIFEQMEQHYNNIEKQKPSGKHWKDLRINDLKSIPTYICIDNNDSVATCTIENLSKVVSRLLNLFRQLSLQVEYTTGYMNHEPYAICQDCDNVRFHVLLWKKPKTNNMDPNELLVQVHYVSGNESLYNKRQYQYRVLQAVLHSDDDDDINDTGVVEFPTTLCHIPVDPLSFNMNDRYEQMDAQESLKRRIGDRTTFDEQINAIWTHIDDLMNSSDTMIANVYEGLLILLNVTNPNHSGYRVAETISKKLFFFDTTAMTSKMVLTLGFTECWYYEGDELLNNNDIRRNETIIKDYSLLALRVIGQAINFLDNDDEESMEAFVTDIEIFFQIDDLFTVSSSFKLYQDIVHADENPHFAYCAAHILERVCKNVVRVRTDFLQNNHPDYITCIQKAMEYGLYNHISLELACQRLLSIVSNSSSSNNNNTE